MAPLAGFILTFDEVLSMTSGHAGSPVRFVLGGVAVCFLGSFALQAQQSSVSTRKTSQSQDQVDVAHQEMLQSIEDRGKEAARLTEDVMGDVPITADVSGDVQRRNFIDDIIFDRIEKDGVPHASLATDQVFIRRAYLDLTGLPPTPEEVRAFVSNSDQAKRSKLIESLIGTEVFAEQWSWFWGDLFRLASEAGSGRRAFHYWFKEALRIDRPYDQIVYDLLTPSTKVHGTIPALAFLARSNQIKSRLVMSPDDYTMHNRLDALDQVNVDINRVFLGLNTSCFSCHDGADHLEEVNLYLTDRTREEFYRQSAFLGKTRILGHWDDKAKNAVRNYYYDDFGKGYDTADDAPFATMSENRFPRLEGESYEPAFLLTGERPRPGFNHREELARMITSHPQFSRATVNLVWGKLMTVAFVEPYNAFDLYRIDPENPPPAPWTIQPTNPELMEALAQNFRDNGFSIHRLITTIMESSAYQLSARFPSKWDDDYINYYARKYVRVLTGPEVVDTITVATGVPAAFPYTGSVAERVKTVSGPQDIGRRRGVDASGGPAAVALMSSFFQSNRMTPAPVGNRASALQAMLMMKSEVVNDRVLAENDSRVQRLVESDRSNTEIVEELFLASLARWPTLEEQELALTTLQADRKAGAENLQWALLNGPEFLVNH